VEVMMSQTGFQFFELIGSAFTLLWVMVDLAALEHSVSFTFHELRWYSIRQDGWVTLFDRIQLSQEFRLTVYHLTFGKSKKKKSKKIKKIRFFFFFF
jgi:hypothetical protein